MIGEEGSGNNWRELPPWQPESGTMRFIGTTLWVSAVLVELQACGPRVSVGDLGAAGAGSGGAEAGSSAQGGSSQARGGTGGVIVAGADGSVAVSFTTPGMFRGLADSSGARRVAIFGDESLQER